MKKIILFSVLLLVASLSQAQWEPDVRLTINQADSWPSANTNAKVIASSGDTLHVVWQDERAGNYEIYYKRSIDNGLNWGEDIRLTNNIGWSEDASLLVSGTIVHVVWDDDRNGGNSEIFYKRSEDGGSTWGEDTRLTNAPLASASPVLVKSGSVLHLVWYDERDDPSGSWFTEIYYKRSTDGGITWEPDIRLTESNEYSGYPGIVAFGSTVLVVWEDYRDYQGEVYCKRSTDEGLSWGPDMRLTNDPGQSWDPCVAEHDSVVHIVWQDDRDGAGYEIYYKRSTDGGLSWGADTRLTDDYAHSEYPTIAVSGSNLHVTWQDQRDGNYEIYYQRSENAGLTWTEDTRLTNAFGGSFWPYIAVNDSAVHVIWYDDRAMNDEIYYKRNPTGNLITGIGNDLVNDNRHQFSIWPNPASTIINIGLDNYSMDVSTLSIHNMLGEEVFSKPIQSGESFIDITSMLNGIYLVGIVSGNKKLVNKKLVISK